MASFRYENFRNKAKLAVLNYLILLRGGSVQDRGHTPFQGRAIPFADGHGRAFFSSVPNGFSGKERRKDRFPILTRVFFSRARP